MSRDKYQISLGRWGKALPTQQHYDETQTNACQLLNRYLDRAALDVAEALNKQGSPDVVEDAINRAMVALRQAHEVNHAIQTDDRDAMNELPAMSNFSQ